MIFPLSQLSVQASDGREPSREANATVVVFIIRDESKPSFESGPYDDARVSENAGVGTTFYTRLRAEDRDLQVETDPWDLTPSILRPPIYIRSLF